MENRMNQILCLQGKSLHQEQPCDCKREYEKEIPFTPDQQYEIDTYGTEPEHHMDGCPLYELPYVRKEDMDNCACYDVACGEE